MSGERELARALDRDAVGDRQRRVDVDRLAGRQRRRERRDGLDLHADDLDVRPRGLDRDRDAAGQPAAADRHDDLREVGHVLEQLEPERALAGDDVGVVERVHERHARLAPRARAPRRRSRRPTRRRRRPCAPSAAAPSTLAIGALGAA